MVHRRSYCLFENLFFKGCRENIEDTQTLHVVFQCGLNKTVLLAAEELHNIAHFLNTLSFMYMYEICSYYNCTGTIYTFYIF